jgi:hypothetical protein
LGPTLCSSNLKNIGTALEMYSTDNSGRYPKKLSLLTPNYLKRIPLCDKAHKDTYSHSYKVSANPDGYTVICEGKHHGQANYPRYTSTEGLLMGKTIDSPRPADLSKPKEAAWATSPTLVVTVGLLDLTKTQAIMDQVKALIGPLGPAAPKVGEVQLYGSENASPPFYWCITATPVRMLVIGVGGEARQMVTDAITPHPGAVFPASYRAAWKDQPQPWISQGYLDLTSTMKAVRQLLASAPDPRARALTSLLQGDAVTSYFVGSDGEGIVAEARGNGPMIAGQLMVAAAILVPNFSHARSQGQLVACKSNLRNIGTALEMYSTDNVGYYPKDLKALEPNYLKHIPQCPACERDSYSESYQVNNQPDHFSYTVCCHGANHSKVGLAENMPQYNSFQGLITEPHK